VPVLTSDTADTLAARVLEAEHKLYPLALRLVAEGKVRVIEERTEIAGSVLDIAGFALFNPPER